MNHSNMISCCFLVKYNQIKQRALIGCQFASIILNCSQTSQTYIICEERGKSNQNGSLQVNHYETKYGSQSEGTHNYRIIVTKLTKQGFTVYSQLNKANSHYQNQIMKQESQCLTNRQWAQSPYGVYKLIHSSTLISAQLNKYGLLFPSFALNYQKINKAARILQQITQIVQPNAQKNKSISKDKHISKKQVCRLKKNYQSIQSMKIYHGICQNDNYCAKRIDNLGLKSICRNNYDRVIMNHQQRLKGLTYSFYSFMGIWIKGNMPTIINNGGDLSKQIANLSAIESLFEEVKPYNLFQQRNKGTSKILQLVQPQSGQSRTICEYFYNGLKLCLSTSESKNSQFKGFKTDKCSISAIYKVNPEGKKIQLVRSQTEQQININNRYLLWHGTPIHNLKNILRNGLQIRHSQNQSDHNNRFGSQHKSKNTDRLSNQQVQKVNIIESLGKYGLYFAEASYKALQYTNISVNGQSKSPKLQKISQLIINNSNKPPGVLLLCQVELGAQPEYTYHPIHSRLAGSKSIVAVGRYHTGVMPKNTLKTNLSISIKSQQQVPSQLQSIPITVPIGPLCYQNDESNFQVSEFAVYQQKNVTLRYVVFVEQSSNHMKNQSWIPNLSNKSQIQL